MKIALSASYFEVRAVRDALCKCDVVYTTNVDRRDDLREALGLCRVRFIPFSTAAIHDFLIDTHCPVDEVLRFSDLRNIVQAEIDRVDTKTIRLMAGYFGFSFDTAGDMEAWTEIQTGKKFTCLAGEFPQAVAGLMSSRM